MCGLPVIDLQDWQRHTDYTGEFERKGGNHKVRNKAAARITCVLVGRAAWRGGGW